MTFCLQRGDELQRIERYRALRPAVVAAIALAVADDAAVAHFARRTRMLRHAAIRHIDRVDLHPVLTSLNAKNGRRSGIVVRQCNKQLRAKKGNRGERGRPSIGSRSPRSSTGWSRTSSQV